jgi:PAS domain S-box-containing protein
MTITKKKYPKIYSVADRHKMTMAENRKSVRNISEINSTFFENSLDAMMIGSQDGRIYTANPAACKMLGRSEKEICKLGRQGIVEQNPNLTEAVRKRKESGNFFGELTLIKKDGTPFPGEVSSSVFTDSDRREFTTLIIRDITARKKNEQALNESEFSAKQANDWQQNIFEGSLDAIFISDEESVFIAVNNAASDLTGYSKEQLLKMRIPDLHDEPDLEAYKKFHSRIYKGEKILSEANIRRRDGIKVCTEFNNSRISISGKLYMHTTARDISARKKSERELFEFGEKYRLLMENSGLGIGFYSIDGKILMFNQQAISNLGGKAGDYIGKNVTEVFGKEAGQIYIDRFILAAASEKPLKVEDHVDLDGKPGWYMSTITRILDQNGKVDGIQVIADNITERKIIEERIKTSEEDYRSLFENSIMGISQVRPGGTYIRINKAYAELYGYPDTSTMIKEMSSSPKLFSNPDDRKKVLDILDKNDYMPPTEFELNRRNGEKFWALVSARQVKNDAGKLLFLQAEHIDITEQKLMEKELRKSKELLEKLNQHLVEAIENERNQIALNLHDDLGQKLTAINLDIVWLKSRIGVQSKSVREKFEEMSSMIKETVESIRETSSLLRPAILFDLGIIAAIKSQLVSFEKQTGIKCHFYFEPEEFDLEDRLALILYRILQESLTNIARHSGASATEIELVILKNKIEMIIEDNGKGIAKDKVNSLESLGIAGMKERVKSANGKIIIRGGTGAGTRIKVIIPLIKEKVDD